MVMLRDSLSWNFEVLQGLDTTVIAGTMRTRSEGNLAGRQMGDLVGLVVGNEGDAL